MDRQQRLHMLREVLRERHQEVLRLQVVPASLVVQASAHPGGAAAQWDLWRRLCSFCSLFSFLSFSSLLCLRRSPAPGGMLQAGAALDALDAAGNTTAAIGKGFPFIRSI